VTNGYNQIENSGTKVYGSVRHMVQNNETCYTRRRRKNCKNGPKTKKKKKQVHLDESKRRLRSKAP
jgi:hypothetical protein